MPKLSDLSKLSEIVKVIRNCPKIMGGKSIFSRKINFFSLKKSIVLFLKIYFFGKSIFLFQEIHIFFLGKSICFSQNFQVMSPHHSDQMNQRSKVVLGSSLTTNGLSYVPKSKVAQPVSQSVSQ